MDEDLVNSENILIIEDDIQLTFFVKTILEREGYQVNTFYNGSDGLTEAYKNTYSLILLDINLPGTDGISVCKKVREISEVPIIFFTAQDKVHERVEGLDAGANDYIIKPVEVPELLARVRAHLRFKYHLKNDTASGKSSQLVFHDLTLDINSREITRDNIQISLSPKEFDIILYFMKNPNITLTKQQIFEEVWQSHFNNISDKRVVDEHINNLRRKIHLEGFPKLLHTVYGIGHILR